MVRQDLLIKKGLKFAFEWKGSTDSILVYVESDTNPSPIVKFNLTNRLNERFVKKKENARKKQFGCLRI